MGWTSGNIGEKDHPVSKMGNVAIVGRNECDGTTNGTVVMFVPAATGTAWSDELALLLKSRVRTLISS